MIKFPRSLQTLLAFIVGFAVCNFLNAFYQTGIDSNTSTIVVEDSIHIGDTNAKTAFTKKLNDKIKANSPSKPESIEDAIKDYLQKKKKEETGNDPSDNNSFDNGNAASNKNKNNDVCSILGKPTPTTISTWSNHMKKIFESSRHNADKDFVWHDFTAKLLSIMSPQRLQSSIKTIPKKDEQWKTIESILDVAFQRWKYLKQQRIGKPPRKVNILVMGGSVTMGVQCTQNPVQESRLARRDCAWPSRLNQFLNSFFGFYPNDLIRMDVLTLGGTNTNTATTIWDYTLMPHDIPYPDVVIHAYATNDMHVLSAIEAQKQNITLEEMIMKVNQKFVQKILTPKDSSSSSCRRRKPFLLYYDDYIGNEQRKIIETNAFSKASQILSTHYDFHLVSYADAVKDLVYGHMSEEWLSPHGWPERQVHPGMGMHIVSTWVIAFNLLHLATTYCSIHDILHQSGSNDNGVSGGTKPMKRTISERKVKNYIPINGLPPLKNAEIKLKGEPFEPLHHALPPELSDTLTIDNISERWENEENAVQLATKDFQMIQCDNNFDEPMPRPCMFSWVGGLERKFDKPQHLEKRLKSVITQNNGWEATDESSKLGYCATKAGASFEMEFNHVITPVQTLNFLVMKSYGEKWEGSRIRVDATVLMKSSNQHLTSDVNIDNTLTRSIEIVGFHDKKTSETYTIQLDLGLDRQDDGREFDNLRVRIELIGGSTFKIMGMAFCDH